MQRLVSTIKFTDISFSSPKPLSSMPSVKPSSKKDESSLDLPKTAKARPVSAQSVTSRISYRPGRYNRPKSNRISKSVSSLSLQSFKSTVNFLAIFYFHYFVFELLSRDLESKLLLT